MTQRHARSKAACTIFTGDCRTVLFPELSHGSTDLCFFDPPFNQGEDYDAHDDQMDPAEHTQLLREVTLRLVDATRTGGALWFYVPDAVATWLPAFLGGLPVSLINWIIVYQQFGQCRFTSFIRAKHHLLYYVKDGGGARTWNVEDVLEPSARLKMGDLRTAKSQYRGYRPFTDVWTGPYLSRVQGNDLERCAAHPNQLRELLLARVIRCSSNPGDLVVDPCVGSGTTAVVANALGRRFMGAEISAQYANNARARMKSGPVRHVAGKLYDAAFDNPCTASE